MTSNAPDTAVYAEQRARDWEAFRTSTAPLPDFMAWYEEYSHGWKIPIEFLQPVGLDAPDFLEPLQPLLDALSGLEEVELMPVPFMHMTTVHVGFLMATDVMWSQVESIYVNAAPRLHRLDPFDLHVGGVSAGEHTLYLGVDDGLVSKEIRRHVRNAVPVVYEKARHASDWDDFVPRIDFAYFTGKGSRERVVEAVTPFLDARGGTVRVDKAKMARVPIDPQTGFGDVDVIAEIGLLGEAARSGYHN
jgi:hypothetical protein